MAVRRRRPLVPPPYPRRNRYTPLSSGQTTLHSLPAAPRARNAPLSLLFPPQTLRWFAAGTLWGKTNCAPLAPGCAESSQRSVVPPLPTANAALVCGGNPVGKNKLRSTCSRLRRELATLRCPSSSHRKRCSGNGVGCKESSILGSFLGYLAGYQWRL